MGIFTQRGQNNTAEAESQLTKYFLGHELLTALIYEVLDASVTEENEWIMKCQNYYDSCKRMVIVGPDLFAIRWIESHKESQLGPDGQYHSVEIVDEEKSIAYGYTNSGYRPLHDMHIDDTTIKLNIVVRLWTKAIKAQMEKKFPELSFSEKIENDGDRCSFCYYIPKPEWKDWI